MYIAVAAAALSAALGGHHGTVTVQAGDTLSGIAAEHCGSAAAFPALAAASRIGNPDLIYPGQRVTIACHTTAAATTAQVRPAGRHARPDSRGRVWGVTYGYPNRCGDGDGDGWDLPCSALHRAAAPAAVPAPTRRGRHARTSTSTSGYHRSGSYSYDGLRQLWISAGGPASAADQAARIAQCESGGRANAYNPSGATGVWQILGQVRPGNLNDPGVNAANAVAKYRASGGNFSQWVCKG